MRIALATITLSLIAGLILQLAPRAEFTDAALCLQPLSMFGPVLAVIVLIIGDAPFRAYFLRPLAHMKPWFRILAATLALLMLSLLIFNWAISDPTGELEGASMFWGHPLPWITTGYFYGGFGGEWIRSHGGYTYIFRDTRWYENPRIMIDGLLFNTVFFFSYSLVFFRVFEWKIEKRP